jgi:hypothetical protein
MKLPQRFRYKDIAEASEKRVREREEHRDAEADDERGVDEAQQQEHLRLQLRHELRLARRAFEKAAAHDADADTGAERAQADHETDADAGGGLDLGDQLKLVHGFFLSVMTLGWKTARRRYRG